MVDDERTPAQNAEWMEVVVPVASAVAEEIAGALTTAVPAASRGVELRADGIVFWVGRAEAPEAVRDVRALVGTLAAAGVAVDPAGVRMAAGLPEREWRDAWKRHFHTMRVSEHLVIVPSWETYVPRPGDTVLEVDPGRAFGTGAHASTQLCLMELDAISPDVDVRRFLDVGTGSGILAIAAARLWPGAAGVAIDIDPEAVAAATENSQRNRVADRIRFAVAPVAGIRGVYDVVTANIEADVLTSLRGEIAARLAPGGCLILSGLLTNEADDVGRAYAALAGYQLVRLRRSAADPEWSCAVLTRD